MIASMFRIGFLTLTGLVLAWASALFLPSWSEMLVAAEQESFEAAFSPSGRTATALSSPDREGFPARLVRNLVGDSRFFPQATLIVNRRVGVASRVLPFVGLTLALSLAAGLLLRERLRLGQSYASPSLSFLAKRLAESALLLFLVWSFSPAPLPYWGFYPLLGALAIGSSTYVANLPLRL